MQKQQPPSPSSHDEVAPKHPRVVLVVGLQYARIVREVHRLADEEGRSPLFFPEKELHPIHHWTAIERAMSGAGRMVIGTHSESIILRTGREIHDGKLPREDVRIVVLDNDDAGEPRSTVACYDEKGALRNWPMGFLSPTGHKSRASTS